MGPSTLVRFVIISVAAAELYGQSDDVVGATSRPTLEKSFLPKDGKWLRNLEMVTATPKIKGGTRCPVDRFPYMVSIRDRVSLKHICGGVLLNRYWVLTAAHCLTNSGKNPVVVAGTNLIDHGGQGEELLATQSIPHPRFNGEALDGNDIALVKLLNPTTRVDVFANLPDQNTEYSAGQKLLAIGWGGDGTKIENSLDCSQDLLVLGQGQCQSFWSMADSRVDITRSMVCAFGVISDTCEGDSGGPLIDAQSPGGDFSGGSPNFDIISGLTSFGVSCENKQSNQVLPGVYTSVPKFRQWIEEVMSEPRPTVDDDDDYTPPPISGEVEALQFLQSMD